MKFTPWFDAIDQRPVRVGEYDYMCLFTGLHRFWWNGSNWGSVDNGDFYAIVPYCGDKWRGVLRNEVETYMMIERGSFKFVFTETPLGDQVDLMKDGNFLEALGFALHAQQQGLMQVYYQGYEIAATTLEDCAGVVSNTTLVQLIMTKDVRSLIAGSFPPI